MSSYQHPDLVALDELEDLLEAYAEARLSPSSPILARMRRAVVTTAASTPAALPAQAAVENHRQPLRSFLQLAWLPRPHIPAAAFALVFSVALGLGTGAAVLGAPAGSPFFNARVTLEQLFLPTQIDARLAAHKEHLDARLAEAEAAAARGDAAALAAALTAFDSEVAQAIAARGLDADHLAYLEAMLAKHVAVLESLQPKAPEQAAIDRALENSQKAIVKIKQKKQNGQPGSNPGGRPPDRGPQD